MGMDIKDKFDRLQSICMATGRFDRVNTHEPKNAPGRGLTAALWIDKVQPASSGLAKTNVKVVFKIRLYTSMLMEPPDLIDPELMYALDDVMAALTADFTLGDTIQAIDLLGKEQGHPLMMESGYINIDTRVMRVFTINVPLILNDTWEQVA